MDIFDEILSALQAEQRIMLATIISTTGSTPACADSSMLVKQGGVVSVGTVGGGCMEGEVLLQANRRYDAGTAHILTYHLNEDEMGRGLICGGSLDILLEPITRDQIPLFERLRTLRDKGEDTVLGTLMDKDGHVTKKFMIDAHALREQFDVVHTFPNDIGEIDVPSSHIVEGARVSLRRQEVQRIAAGKNQFILQPVFGAPALFIFGGGHVGRSISRAASIVGFHVTVVDDRHQYANPQRFPEAARTIAGDVLELIPGIVITSSSYVVIVTRGHRLDEDILERLLQTPARYIGMIGSRRKVMAAYEHLVQRGISVEQLQLVHAPIGIEIGAMTAEEIAVSVVAQLIRIRRGGGETIHDKSYEMKSMIESLKKQSAVDR